MMTIGEKIKYHREQKNYTQAKMAELLNISINSYGNIERDETDVTFSRLLLISKELDVPMKDLIDIDGKIIYIECNENQNNTLNNVNYNSTITAPTKDVALLEQENTFLKEKISNLEEIIVLLKEKGK
jgi:transcriptional regulator with XRE-family HTH domain